jgi:hypothetical protein
VTVTSGNTRNVEGVILEFWTTETSPGLTVHGANLRWRYMRLGADPCAFGASRARGGAQSYKWTLPDPIAHGARRAAMTRGYKAAQISQS